MTFRKSITGKLAAASVCAGIAAWAWQPSPHHVTPVAIVHVPNAVSPPLKGVSIPFERFEVDASKEQTIRTASGNTIHVPANAIKDDSGKTVTGNITLLYRQFNDAVDYFIAGIPMTYDSAGTQYHFESAGMFELKAGDSSLSLQSPVTVTYLSANPDDRFNLYRLDETSGRWDYLGHSDVVQPDVPEMLASANEGILPGTLPEQLPPPTAGRFRIKLDVLESEFPEIAAYGDVSFEVVDDSKADPSLAQRDWDHAEITRLPSGNYRLHLEDNREVFEFEARPVMNAPDTEQARIRMEEKYGEAEKIKANKRSESNKMQAEKTERFVQQKNNQSRSLNNYRVGQMYANGVAASGEMAVRLFTVDGFGIYNSDCPRNLPQGMMVNAKLKDKMLKVSDTTKLAFLKLYLVEKDSKMLYTYYSDWASRFAFNPDKENCMWTVTDDNRLAKFTVEQFRDVSVRKQGDVYCFRMEVSERPLDSPEDVREFLNMDK
ncbi:MAG: hypothetical protein H6585_08460 [Flavobacteriales bacterium]|nr:hypothetical protein [Flavobacteriales bacterium]MCB9448361.1 hypothetical protein [Flavobacteriales bacterium]